jgi:ATP-dependent DNA helicase PIF1
MHDKTDDPMIRDIDALIGKYGNVIKRMEDFIPTDKSEASLDEPYATEESFSEDSCDDDLGCIQIAPESNMPVSTGGLSAEVCDGLTPRDRLNAAVAEAGIVLGRDQKTVIDLVLEGHNLMISGEAGTGKTLILNLLKKTLTNFSVTATTGIASTHIGGRSLHSWSGFRAGDEEKDITTIISRIFSTSKTGAEDTPVARIQGCEVLAIDEVSMLDAFMFAKLDTAFREIRGKIDAPFGGIQMLLFGDFHQLAPVTKDRKPTFYAFESGSWRDAGFKTIVMRDVYRQADALFSRVLGKIRVGTIDTEVQNVINSRLYSNLDKSIYNDGLKPIVVHTHNEKAQKINERELNNIHGKSTFITAKEWFRPSTSDDASDYSQVLESMKRNILADASLELKVGAQVMLLANLDFEEGLVNGSMGVVEGWGTLPEVSKDMLFPVVTFRNGITRTIGYNNWDTENSTGTLIARFTQVPLCLAWAITAHKCQGMTLDKVEVNLSNCFSDGQAYVALSRARTLDGLCIKSISNTSIKVSHKVKQFYANNTYNRD